MECLDVQTQTSPILLPTFSSRGFQPKLFRWFVVFEFEKSVVLFVALEARFSGKSQNTKKIHKFRASNFFSSKTTGLKSYTQVWIWNILFVARHSSQTFWFCCLHENPDSPRVPYSAQYLCFSGEANSSIRVTGNKFRTSGSQLTISLTWILVSCKNLVVLILPLLYWLIKKPKCH